MKHRLGFWDFMLVVALGLIVAGMSLPWWSYNASDLLGGLGPFGFTMDLTGWGAPLAGLGISSLVLGLLAFGLAALKLSVPETSALPAWYKEGWLVVFLGGACTLFGVIVCLMVPTGGFALWSWRPGSALVLGGGVVMLVAGVAMSKDKTGTYQGAGRSGPVGMGPTLVPPRASALAAPWTARPSERPQVGTLLLCAACGTVLPRDAAYCSNCGGRISRPASLDGTASLCVRCDAPLEPGAACCSACGWRV